MEQIKHQQTKSKTKPRPVSEARKIRKPLMERKRRERINVSLTELARLLTLANKVKSEGSKGTNKLEKADILEMTVSHLQNLQNIQGKSPAAEVKNLTEEKYQQGFTECIKVVEKALKKSTGDVLREKLLNHLNSRLKGLSCPKKILTTSDENTPPASVVPQLKQLSIPNQSLRLAEVPKDNENTSLTLVPTELPDGGVAFVLKGDTHRLLKEWNQTSVEVVPSINDRSCQPPPAKKLRELKVKDFSLTLKSENIPIVPNAMNSYTSSELHSAEEISHTVIDSTVCSLVSYDHQQTNPREFENILTNNVFPKQSPDLCPVIDEPNSSSASSTFSSDSYYVNVDNASSSDLPTLREEPDLLSMEEQYHRSRNFPNAYSIPNASISDHYVSSRYSQDKLPLIPSYSHNVIPEPTNYTSNQVLYSDYRHENYTLPSTESSQRCGLNNKSNCPPTPPPSPPTENRKPPMEPLNQNNLNQPDMDLPFDLSINKMWRPW